LGAAVSVVTGIFSGAAAAATAVASVAGAILTSSVVTTALTTIGTSMIIGGITDLLSPQNPVPDASSVSDIDPAIRGSYTFSGIQNVSSSGVPIPIIYGLVFSGSIIISSGTDSTQVVKSIT
jgi:predicted phage tail protein